MLPLVIQLGSIIVGKVVAKEIKKWWEEDQRIKSKFK